MISIQVGERSGEASAIHLDRHMKSLELLLCEIVVFICNLLLVNGQVDIDSRGYATGRDLGYRKKQSMEQIPRTVDVSDPAAVEV